MTVHPFTEYIVESGVLGEARCTVVDVGASGGIAREWFVFGPHLRGIGFDMLENEVEELNRRIDSCLDITYHAYGIGTGGYRAKTGADSNRVTPSRLTANPDQHVLAFNFSSDEAKVTSRFTSLDDFFRDEKGSLDFLKIDTDGADFDVLLSGERMLAENRVLGLEVECQFHGETGAEAGVFANIDTFLRKRGFSLFDLETVRTSRRALPAKAVNLTVEESDRGQIIWANAVYFRDLADENAPARQDFPVDRTTILKLACLFELHGLNDCAAELIQANREALREALDTDRALDLLTKGFYNEFDSYAEHMEAFENDRAYFLPGMHGLMEQYGIGYAEYIDLMKTLRSMRTHVDTVDLAGKKVAFYGAGGRFTTLYPAMRDTLSTAAEVMLCDSSPAKRGQSLLGLTILSPEEMAQAGTDVVLVTSVYYREIVLGLQQLARKHGTDFDITLLD